MELEERILNCLNKVISTSIDILEPEKKLREDFGMDSVDLVMFQVEIEEEFRFEFDPIKDDFEKIFESCGSLYQYLKGKE